MPGRGRISNAITLRSCETHRESFATRQISQRSRVYVLKRRHQIDTTSHPGRDCASVDRQVGSRPIIDPTPVQEANTSDCDVANLLQLSGDVKGTTADEYIVGNLAGLRTAPGDDPLTASKPVVHHSIVRDIEFVGGPEEPLRSERDERGVFAGGRLPDQVAYHECDATVGELELITCATTLFVGEAVIENLAFSRPALEQMSVVPRVEVARRDGSRAMRPT